MNDSTTFDGFVTRVEIQIGDTIQVGGSRVRFEERPPALVLMHGFAGDRRGVSGMARRIAAERPDLPALFLSGYPDDEVDFGRDFDLGDHCVFAEPRLLRYR